MHCSKCGRTMMESLCYAMLADLGCSLSWDPAKCDDGEEHEWVKEEPAETEVEPVEEATE